MNFLNGFRNFFEDMDETPDKTRDKALGADKKHTEKQDYLDALQGEEGITWKDLATILQTEPWVTSHFDINDQLHKLSSWEIVKGSLTQHGADIRLKPGKHDKSYKKGKKSIEQAKYPDTTRYHLNRKQLIKFLTSGWMPAVQQSQSGSPGIMPGGPT